MDWIQVFTIIIAVSSMFLWVTRESNSDSKELRGMILKLSDEIQKENRDFHGRLCRLEEKYYQMLGKKAESK